MKVIIDGKEVPCQNDVKVIYEDEIIDAEYGYANGYPLDPKVTRGELHITLNCEGMVADTIHDGEQYKSTWEDIEDIIERTH